MLLLADDSLAARRVAVQAGDLAALRRSLEAPLLRVIERELFVPETKALLSRAGGRCERDGANLDFDPHSPWEHRCPVCGTVHRGDLHHRAWVTSYHLWLIERAAQAAVLHALQPDARLADFTRRVLDAYAAIYLRLPNRDNVLGPTRLFFSTYLESIWLLNACVAIDALGDHALAGRVADRVVQPSARLIAEYDEGMSNRQVWNNSALLAAARILGDADAFAARVDGGHGVAVHLQRGLLPDATWYEGENYHFFAMRGLWYAVAMCEAAGTSLDERLVRRFDRAFATPYLTALPDFTMLARKDSQYAVSLRQWRLAEFAELGFARSGDPVLATALACCYAASGATAATTRDHSTADVERNGPPTPLSRADLGWRALLHAAPVLPATPATEARSVLLDAQGIAVFRRSPGVYVALDYGESGGGHGHPDRLNLVLACDATRWLDDLGTGSYVDPSLHWYRSTLAHNAPLVNGRSQPLRDGRLIAYDERDGVGWIVAAFAIPADDVTLERAVVVTPDYLVDELRVTAGRVARVELPLHLDARCEELPFTASTVSGGDDPEDGFGFVHDARAAEVPASSSVRLVADGLDAVLWVRGDATLVAARAPGQPAATQRPFYMMRMEVAPGAMLCCRTVLAWTPGWRVIGSESGVQLERGVERHGHRRADAGWHVDFHAAGARSSIDLRGFRSLQPAPAQPEDPVPVPPVPLRRCPTLPDSADAAPAVRFQLGEAHYRRTDESWVEAGAPTAEVAFAADPSRLRAFVRVHAGDPRFVAAEARNAYDNEQADTMGAGVQLYVRTPDGGGAWILVPAANADVRVRPIGGWGDIAPPRAVWRSSASGYEVIVDLALPATARVAEYPVDVDVIVNETTHDRERRRGQLVLSGARGEFAYLRGDRHEPARLIPLVLVQ